MNKLKCSTADSNNFFNYNTNKVAKENAVTELLYKTPEIKPQISCTYNYSVSLKFQKNTEIDHLRTAMANFAKAAVNEELDGIIFLSYKALSEFLSNFEPSFHPTKQSLSNYKRRKLVYKPFMINDQVKRFLDYVKEFYPSFNTKAFLSLPINVSPYNRQDIDGLVRSNVYKLTQETKKTN